MPDMERVMRTLDLHMASTDVEKAYVQGYHEGLSQARYEVALVLIGVFLGWALWVFPPGLHWLAPLTVASLAVLIARILRGERQPPEYRTVDGGHLAPYPGMTDADLYEFEITMHAPNRTFRNPPGTSA